ncbi:peptidoglycan-binding domain-containing protein [Desertibaculum subflavum]|uniref:peptidoglycan-binding domain-containing protein n=1 Tax=Desertibaculum subflavum TaxID=2268458 RepID=UPI000E66814A
MRLSLLFASTALVGSVLVAGCSDSGMFGRSSTATPSTAAQQAAAQPAPRADVRETQQQLKSLGLYDGPIDGVWGPETQTAVERYQTQRGLSATGRVDESTRNSLREASAGRAGTASNQDRMAATSPGTTGSMTTDDRNRSTPGTATPGTSGGATADTTANRNAGTAQRQQQPQDIAPAAGMSAAAAIAPRNLSAGNVRAIQSRLAGEGYYRAGIDGVWGPRSRQALVNFQTQNQLRADGLMDPRTANALNLDYQQLGDAGWTSGQPGDRNVRQRSRNTTGERVGSESPRLGPSVPRQ